MWLWRLGMTCRILGLWRGKASLLAFALPALGMVVFVWWLWAFG